MQPAYVAKSVISAGAAAMACEEEKDNQHDSKVNAARGYFYPLVVESQWHNLLQGVHQLGRCLYSPVCAVGGSVGGV